MTRWRLLTIIAGLLAGVVTLMLHQPLHAAVETPAQEQMGANTPALDVPAMESRLSHYPLFGNFDAPEVKAIFQHGQSLGNRANVFTTVGDSNTTNGDFMRPLGMKPNDCDLGDYKALQKTIDYFSAISPRQGQANSFVNESAAAAMGYSTALVLDPAWKDWKVCRKRNETPLQCEYRLVQPSVSIIMLGQIDINTGGLTADEYRANMDEIIRTSIDDGVIPVVTTIVFLPTKEVYSLSLQYDMALLDLADQYHIPVINLWPVAQMMPNHGIGPDNSHLSTHVGSFCAFNGPETQYGNVRRNLMTLQALDTLRATVLEKGATSP